MRSLVATLGATAAALVVVVLDVIGLPLGAPRIVAGAFLAFLAPGLAILLASRAPFLDGAAMTVLAIPMSLAFAAIVGVVLDQTPLGLRTQPMTVVTGAVTVGLLVVAVLRERRARPEPVEPEEPAWPVEPAWPPVAPLGDAPSSGPRIRRTGGASPR